MKYFMWLAFGLLLLPGQMANAQEEKGAEAAEKVGAAEDTPFQILQKEFKAVEANYMEQRNSLFKEYQAAKDDEAQQAIIAKLQPIEEAANALRKEVGGKIRELLEAAEPNDDSMEMAIWIVKNIQTEEMQAYAIDRVITHHVTSEKILEMIPALARSMPSETTQSALERIAADGANDEVKGNAAISLAELLYEARSMGKEYLGMGEGALEGLPETMIAFVKKSAELTDEQIEAMYRNAAEKYADVAFRKATIAKFVENKLKSIEIQKNLQVGKIAPDIEGPDIDGVNFKLSDYRGKVVMLDFWGDW